MSEKFMPETTLRLDKVLKDASLTPAILHALLSLLEADDTLTLECHRIGVLRKCKLLRAEVEDADETYGDAYDREEARKLLGLPSDPADAQLMVDITAAWDADRLAHNAFDKATCDKLQQLLSEK